MVKGKQKTKPTNNIGAVLFIIIVILIIILGIVLGIGGRTGAAIASFINNENGHGLTIENLGLKRNNNFITPQSENETHVFWNVNAGTYVDLFEVNAAAGIAGVVCAGIINRGNPVFPGLDEGLLLFSHIKETKLNAINKVDPHLAEMLAPPNFVIENGFVVPTTFAHIAFGLPLFPPDFFAIPIVVDEGGPFVWGMATSQLLELEMILRPGNDFCFYCLACDHVCQKSKIKCIKVRVPPGGGSGGGGAGCTYYERCEPIEPCRPDGLQKVKCMRKSNRPCPEDGSRLPTFCCRDQELPFGGIREQACTYVPPPQWPPGQQTTQGQPAYPAAPPSPPPPTPPPAPEPTMAPPKVEQPAPAYVPPEQIQFAGRNCITLPTFIGNVKVCWNK